MKKLLLVALVVGLLMPAASARAATIGSTPASNDVIGIMEGWFGASLYLIGGPADIQVQYINKEAGWTNLFNFQGGAVEINTATTAPGTVFNFLGVSSGLLNFSFSTVDTGDSVANGSNIEPTGLLGDLNFFVTFDDNVVNGVTPGGGQTVLIAFDDTGAGSDDNHDDLVVRLTITGGTFHVPDGGMTLALFGGALLGLGALRRRIGR
jgi:hypothetical protein